MLSTELVDLSRLQFAATALYHYLFVPLTLGLSMIVFVMEYCYVKTGKQVYKDMTKFWGKLFGINFALGVTTGITMEFEFGTNWSYYSHYVGDIFGAPLAIEGLMAFFLESTFVGLFFFGWNKLSKLGHITCTFLMALGSNLSALWILVANAWMQYPAGSEFSTATMRMELTDFWNVILSPWAQTKFLHTLFAGYTTGACFVLAISAFYILKKRDLEFAKRSFSVAAIFGLISILVTVWQGDESGYQAAQDQPAKLAAMEGMWETHESPAPLAILAISDPENQENLFELSIPWAAGIMATRSFDQVVPGLKQIVAENAVKIKSGVQAAIALEKLQNNPNDAEAQEQFNQNRKNLGYGLLTKQYQTDSKLVTDEDIAKAAKDSIPYSINSMFYTFRLMVGFGTLLLLIFGGAIYLLWKKQLQSKKWFLYCCLWSLPLPWIANECGWFVAEYGRQPWAIWDVLPTHLAVSTLSVQSVWGSLTAFTILYTGLLIVEAWLMWKFAKIGPSSLGTGAYHHEQQANA
ncbi:MAG: cytochrome ubiquinol oxidase subunit I [Burkholderiales bacterium]|nr:cytochrome ubiquinol oxidase subunit I [Burkholderiales bacterium]